METIWMQSLLSQSRKKRWSTWLYITAGIGAGIGITIAAATYMRETRKVEKDEGKMEQPCEQQEDVSEVEYAEDDKLKQAFEQACDFVSYSAVATDLFSNDNMLELYGLYKQALFGDCSASGEVGWGINGYKNQAKAKAWAKRKGMSKSEAMQAYIATVQTEATKVDVDLKEQLSMDADAANQNSMTHNLRPATSILRDSYEDEEEEDDKDAAEESTSDWFNMAVEGDIDQLMQMLSDEISSGSSKQVDINEQDRKCRTALHWACDKGNLQLVKFLLSMGANPNVEDSDGQTPLHYAAICEYRDVYDTLVISGGNENKADLCGETPLSYNE